MRARIAVVILLLFGVLFFGGGSFISTNEQNFMSIEFCYKGKVWKWSDQEIINNTSIFTHSAQAQKNGRQGSNVQRASLIERIHNMGFSYEDSFDYTFSGLRDKADKMCNSINTQMVNATINFNAKRSPFFSYTEEKTGYYVCKEALYEDLLLQIKQKSQVRIEVQPQVIEPQVTKESLIKRSQLKSKFETNYTTSSANRKNNIKLAMMNFNGLVLEPDQEYSFNKITGKRTEAMGYKEANIIVNDEYTEAFGGGVCQASTTLYNALLLAGLDIVEVHPHSLSSSYVMSGFDAMVNFGSSDLRWKNNTDKPIYIRTYTTGDLVGVEVYGQKDGSGITIKRSSQVVEQIKPLDDKIELENTMYVDESEYRTAPRTGCKVESYIEYWKDGKMLSKKRIRTQTYHSVQGVKIVGTKIRQIISQEPKQPQNQEQKQILNDPFDALYPQHSNWEQYNPLAR